MGRRRSRHLRVFQRPARGDVLCLRDSDRHTRARRTQAPDPPAPRDIAPHAAIMKKLLALALMLPSVALAAPFAYVSNQASGTGTAIDTSTDAVVDTRPTRGKPRATAP